MKVEHVLLVIVIVVLVVWLFKGKCSEGFGQDPSTRVASGWIAGPNYGFDPVQDYADQLEMLREKEQNKRKEHYSNVDSPKCNSCLNTEDFTY